MCTRPFLDQGATDLHNAGERSLLHVSSQAGEGLSAGLEGSSGSGLSLLLIPPSRTEPASPRANRDRKRRRGTPGRDRATELRPAGGHRGLVVAPVSASTPPPSLP
ncbi:hypothetical protein AAFF_G00293720 [Aldrovandia affinis]|uniref:Uncharacterized protein n=1 Tax=Aldrovandia affinis TaxID=143900 RepID=A0AAD7W1A2_9TELE|nr:hypothetical protein AAFF_G00293720 [Aldrovandia affinis]